MTKERILDIAAKEFSKSGYDAVSMNHLVKLLGVNKATIYYHYKDKRALYQEVLTASLTEVKENRSKYLEGIDEPKAKFNAYIKSFISMIRQKTYVVGLWMHETANFGSNMDENLLPLVDEKIEFLKALLAELPLKEKYKDVTPYICFSMMHGMIDNFYAMHMSDLPLGDEVMKKDSDKILDYLEEFIPTFMLDAMCEEGEK